MLDKTRSFGQAHRVETPPILTPQPAAPKPKRKGRAKFIVIAIAIVVVLAVTLFFAFHKKDPAISVQSEKIGRHSITETVVANGKVYPVLQVHISPEVSGEITELAVKEGQYVHKGDLLLKIKPEFYLAALNQAKATYQSSLASKTTSAANLEKAVADFKRNKELFDHKLLSDSDYVGFKVALDIANAQLESAGHQVEVAKASVDSAQDSLDKTTILAPIDGTVSKLNTQAGERVLGTVQNAGTDIMVISDLSRMEARVDIGEMDIVLLQPGQKAKLEVDSLKDQKFAGVVTDVANSSKDMNASSSSSFNNNSSSTGQSATQFQVRILFNDGDQLRPGMSVSATIETRTRTNTIAAPIASVTTRVVKPKGKPDMGNTNSIPTNAVVDSGSDTNSSKGNKKGDDKNKPVEVVFIVEGDHVKTVPVKIGISDDNFWEITDGLKEGDEIVTGGYRAISRDLDDGKKIKKGPGGANAGMDKSKS
ncbi:MAG: efflux RND transporter periplasmic adaptor subunit [Verrucomicrobia bacterium]|nr:efflux RND transporter periplasmic adaptor subunit [Verrucomicrobiota bacterium]